jgi:hypothetical protein
VARESEGSYRCERRLDHDRADRQEPNLVFCLTVHQILTLEAMDRSRPIGKTATWKVPAGARLMAGQVRDRIASRIGRGRRLLDKAGDP